MILLAIIGVYSVLGLIAARLVAGHLAWEWTTKHNRHWGRLSEWALVTPSSKYWFWASGLGFLAGLIWPAFVALRLVPSRWAIGAEAAAAREKQRARIAELEQELDLR